MSLEIFYLIGALILLCVLAYAVINFRLKSRRAEALSAEAAREMYEEPERYTKARQQELTEKIERAEDAKEAKKP